MKAVIQRCARACVTVNGEVTGKIDKGFVVLLGVEQGDEIPHADAVADKIYSMRIFCDENGKINLSLGDVGGSLLVISNFTLCADCSHGNRPYFGEAADPEKAEQLYNYFCDRLSGKLNVQKGVFGADMKLELLNDGPVTIVLDSRDLKIKI
ncbi:MAG: D-tyrosyl-tRNA(Tyr) deacylase [Clostridiales bacterium]|nr:D-tyrosyl-tRNA(Tyr) deacylase [Clostridiales bacterium]